MRAIMTRPECRRRPPLLLVGVALLLAYAASAKEEPSSFERLEDEIDDDEAEEGQGSQYASERAGDEMAAKAGMARQYSDALTDIMAVLLHGSDGSKESAVERLIELAMDTGGTGHEQARMFRSAVVAGGALPVLIEEVGSLDMHRQYLAATALHALSLDDPTTELDNFHSLEICQHGAIEPLVRLLSSEHEQLQVAATGALSQLAENPLCQQMIAAAGALEPLTKMATYGSDYHKLGALNALEVLSLNNAATREQLVASGTDKVLDGLSTMGSSLLRKEAGTFKSRLEAPLADGKVAEGAHVKQVRCSRAAPESPTAAHPSSSSSS